MSEVFEWALIRVVPRVERGEAINAGVIVYSKSFRYLKTRIELDERRVLAVDPGAEPRFRNRLQFLLILALAAARHRR